MALISGRSSALNPNAPLFIPAALHQVEDFSPQWWELVKTSTWFRDYWLSQHKEEYVGESANDAAEGEIENMLPETFDMGIEEDLCDLENEFEQLVLLSEAWSNGLNMFNMENKALLKDLMTPKSPKEKGPKSPIGPAKHLEKPPQYVNVKCAPRRIHQPR